MRDLLNIAGQSFIISGFIFFLLAVPLYYVYPPFYTSVEEHATNLLFFSQLGFCWTFVGLYPIILSMAIKNIEVGDLVYFREDLGAAGPGIVLDRVGDVPVGWYNEENEVQTAAKCKVAWQDGQLTDWHWEEALQRYEDVHRGEQ